jgi:hypothetical protein
MPSVASRHEVALDQWSPLDGPARLAQELDPTGALTIPATTSDAMLRSLLSSAQEAASLKSVCINLGLAAGIIIGGILGLVIGSQIFARDLPGPDKVGLLMLEMVTGAAIGGFIGGAMDFRSKRRKIVDKRIREARTKYEVDVRRLDDLASEFGAIVARGARTIRDEFEVGLSR